MKIAPTSQFDQWLSIKTGDVPQPLRACHSAFSIQHSRVAGPDILYKTPAGRPVCLTSSTGKRRV